MSSYTELTTAFFTIKMSHGFYGRTITNLLLLLLLLLGAELPVMVESFGLLNIFPFPLILDAGYPVFNLHLANTLFDIILPSILGSSL